MSLKNSLGLVADTLCGKNHNYMWEMHGPRRKRLMVAEVNLAYTSALIVMDGVEAFVSGGLDKGERAGLRRC